MDIDEAARLEHQRSVDKVVYITNIHEHVTEPLLAELFMQGGPLEGVVIKRTEGKPAFAFVTFEHSESVVYVLSLFQGLELFGRPLNMKPRAGSTHEGKLREAQADMRSRNRNGQQIGSPSYTRSPHQFHQSPHPYQQSPHPYQQSPHPYQQSPHPYQQSPHPYQQSPHQYQQPHQYQHRYESRDNDYGRRGSGYSNGSRRRNERDDYRNRGHHDDREYRDYGRERRANDRRY